MAEVLTSEQVPLAIGDDGVIKIRGTRVPLDTVVAAFRDGASAEEICEQYSTLALADVYQVIGYYLHHAAELVPYFERRERRAAEIRRANEARWPPEGLRDRLLARRPT